MAESKMRHEDGHTSHKEHRKQSVAREGVAVTGGRVGFISRIHRGHESVAVSGKGFNVEGIIGIVTERLSQSLHRRIETVVEIYECVRRPEAALEFGTGNNLPWMFEKQSKNLQRLILQPDAAPLLEKFTRAEIQLKEPKPRTAGVWQRTTT